MKRAIGAFCCLLIGILVTLLVAWWTAAAVETGELQREASPSEHHQLWWRRRAPEAFSQSPERLSRSFGFGIEFVFLSAPPQNLPEARSRGRPKILAEKCIRIRSGWPFFAMEGATWVSPALNLYTKSNLIDLPAFLSPRRPTVPLRPLLLGYALNSCIFALISLASMTVFNVVRRRVRVRRGLCPNCGYPAGPSPQCPECGSRQYLDAQRAA